MEHISFAWTKVPSAVEGHHIKCDAKKKLVDKNINKQINKISQKDAIIMRNIAVGFRVNIFDKIDRTLTDKPCLGKSKRMSRGNVGHSERKLCLNIGNTQQLTNEI